jgi:hypothetical protein
MAHDPLTNVFLFLSAFFATLPLMVIVAFVSYAIGRRKFSLLGLIWLTTLVAITLCLALRLPLFFLSLPDA